jgi:hypothetical protein
MTSEVGQILSPDFGGNQGWQRLTDEPDIRAVEVIRLNTDGPWQWQVVVSVMEFIRDHYERLGS